MPLSPSQRIRLIREISVRLAAEDYALIDLTLEQFSLPVSDTWNGTKEEYVVQMLRRAPDEALSELALHVGVASEQAPIRVDPPFWQPGMFRVFISHLARHKAIAAQLQEALLHYGISGFVAHNDIEPTAEWMTQIETALATAEALVALMHPNFHSSNWTDQEIGFAMGRGLPTFAIRFGQDPYGFIGRFQAFNGARKTPATLAKQLFDAYRKNKQTQRRMAEILVSRFEQSVSFADAKEKMGHLEEMELWDKEFLARIKAAEKNNSQVSGSWGVPERIARLTTKRKKTGLT